MTAYSYNNHMEYIGIVECQKDPIRSQREGKECYLLPANATLTVPPDYDLQAEIPVWNGTTWDIQELPDQTPNFEKIKSSKLAELSDSCNAAIVAGMDVETSQGTEHFSLEETDQINLTTALSVVQSGAAGYPYHADGQLCRMFTAAEIQAIAAASVRHKLYHTTLCNHLLTWARRAESAEELETITYTADALPADLAENMAAILAAAGGPEDV